MIVEQGSGYRHKKEFVNHIKTNHMTFKHLAIFTFCVAATFTQAQNKADSLAEKIAASPDSRKCEYMLQLAEMDLNTYPSQANDLIHKALLIADETNDYESFAGALILRLKLLCAKDSIDEAQKVMSNLKKVAKRSGMKELQAKANLAEADLQTATGEYDKAISSYNMLISSCMKAELHDIAIISANQLGYIYREKAQPEQSQKSFLKAIEIESHSDYPELKAVSLNFLGSHYWRNGQYSLALDYYLQAQDLRSQYCGEYEMATSLINIGNTYQNMGNFDMAIDCQSKALQMAQNWENKLPEAQIMNYIGNIYWRKSLYDSSLVYYDKSLALYAQMGNLLKTASLYDNIGNAFKMNSQFDSAMYHYNKALAIREEYGTKSDIAYSLSNLGSICLKTAKYPQALDYYFQALNIRDELGDKANTASSMVNIGLIYKELSDYEKAIKYQNDALSIYLAIGNNELTASTLNQMGNVHWTSGNLPLALDCHMKALRLRQEIGDKSATASSLNNIGLIYRDMNDTINAEKFFLDALDIYDKSGNLQSAAFVHNNIGDLYTRCGKASLATAQYKMALKVFEAKNDKRGIAITSQNIGQFLYSAKDYANAKAFYDRAMQMARQINDIEIIKNVSLDNFNLYEKTGNQAKALESYKLYIACRDSISNSANIQQMLEMQSLYEINVREKEIELLKSKAENTTLKISSQQRLILFCGIALALSLALCITIYFSYRTKKHANEMLRKTFSIIAHDLRSPVASLSSLTGLLNQDEIELDNDERKELLEQSEQLTHSTLHLLETLLEWSHSQNGDIVEYNPEKLKISALADEVISTAKPVAKNKQLNIVNQIDDSGLQVLADRKGCLLILRNLIMNAVKFSNKGGEIQISARKEQGTAIIGVKDFGIGIAPDDLKRITQGLNSTSRRGTMNEKGFGLGMRFCIDFVHANKGQLWAESEEGKFTVFYFSLPLA